MAINVKLLRKVAKHIAEEPRRYDQNRMLDVDITPEDEIQAPPCGTIGCIAGWACVITAKTRRQARSFGWTRARKALGISQRQSERLFAYTWSAYNGWPEKFRVRYDAALTPARRARVAVARIEHFIKTKGAE